MTAADEYRLLHPIFRKAPALNEFSMGTKFRLIARNIVKINSAKKYQHARQNRGRLVIDGAKNYRRVIVQSHIAKGSTKSFKNHINYIKRDGAGLEGNRPDLFNSDGPIADEKEFINRSQKDLRQFRFMISPEDADQLDLHEFTQRFVDQVEHDLGTKLDWVASIHHNTDHPHIHLVVRGHDVAGNELFISRDYLANGMRNRASWMITNELGVRSERELENELSNAVTAQRYCSLDRQIHRLQEDGIICLNSQQNSFIQQRLEYLSSINLAEKIGPTSWKIADNLKEILHDKSIQNDIVKLLHRDRYIHHDLVNIYDQKIHENISGVVEKVGTKNELTGQKYAVISSENGAKFYIEMHEKFSAIPAVGDQVTVSVKWPMEREKSARYRPRIVVEIIGRSMNNNRSKDREL